jgi:hypothetical protein
MNVYFILFYARLELGNDGNRSESDSGGKEEKIGLG